MPDLMPKCRTQLRVMVNAGLQGGVPWLNNSCKSICPICKSEEEGNYHFLLRCKAMRPEIDLFWSKLFSLIETKATFEPDIISNFLRKCIASRRWPKATLPALYKCIMVYKLVRIPDRLAARGIITPNRSSFSFHAVARWSTNDAFSLLDVLT